MNEERKQTIWQYSDFARVRRFLEPAMIMCLSNLGTCELPAPISRREMVA